MENSITRSVREDQLQAQCTQWFWNTYHAERQMLFHVDNNSWNRVIGAKKKALGVVAGISDLVLILCGTVVFIELKDGDGVQSPEQRSFEEKVVERGHKYKIIRSLDEFKKFVTFNIVRNER